MSWRKQVKGDHDYHDQIKHIVQETMRHHEVSDAKLEAVLTDLLEEMNRITLKIVDDHESARDYIHKRWY
ncbi:hypothetical protein [Exiguobacterium aurantiacum]|uniref:hypothetical protein n=1 Tax=Exiguobacterium aurantiacum TaxID=33987 RepID=UPI001E55A4F1|nr:hypothetical protein [Exiguobacterium aurantiacum]